MSQQPQQVDFDEWVRIIFDRPARLSCGHRQRAPDGRDWSQWENEREEPLDRVLAVQHLEYCTRLFCNATQLLVGFDDDRVAEGLSELTDAHDLLLPLKRLSATESVVAAFVESISVLFRDFMAPRCRGTFGHLDETPTTQLNMTCYMWWDAFAYKGTPDDPRFLHTDEAILSVMQRCLNINHDGVRESALHGLGHWRGYRDRVQKTIDEFLDNTKDLRPELVDYARCARVGAVR